MQQYNNANESTALGATLGATLLAPSQLTQTQPKKVVHIDNKGPFHLREGEDIDESPGYKVSHRDLTQPPNNTMGTTAPQYVNRVVHGSADDPTANGGIGFQESQEINLTNSALVDHIDNELSNSLIINADELMKLQAQRVLDMQGEKTEEQELGDPQVLVDVADVLYPFVKDCIDLNGWKCVDQPNQDEQIQDGREKFGEDLIWSDSHFPIE